MIDYTPFYYFVQKVTLNILTVIPMLSILYRTIRQGSLTQAILPLTVGYLIIQLWSLYVYGFYHKRSDKLYNFHLGRKEVIGAYYYPHEVEYDIYIPIQLVYYGLFSELIGIPIYIYIILCVLWVKRRKWKEVEKYGEYSV